MAPEDGHHAFHEDASHPHVGLRGLLVLVSAHDWQAGGPTYIRRYNDDPRTVRDVEGHPLRPHHDAGGLNSNPHPRENITITYA